MKKIWLVFLLILVLLAAGCQQEVETSEDETAGPESPLESITEDMLEERAEPQYVQEPEMPEEVPEAEPEEEELSVGACGETRNLCRVSVAVEEATEEASAYRSLVCVGTYPECVEKYGDCECGAPVEEKCCCFTDIGSYQKKYVSECSQCVDSKKCEASYKDLSDCDLKKNTCYYMTGPVSLEDQYIDSTLIAFTCQGSFQDCTAAYGKCECGVIAETCTESTHDCFRGNEQTECTGNLDYCLRKNDDCTCGKMITCEKNSFICYQKEEKYGCSGEYDYCAGRYEKCLCGSPGQACSERKHRCYNSAQTTTTYVEAEPEICEGVYYDCAREYDWCECGTDEQVDYSCPLTQHSCIDKVCFGTYDECVQKYGDCDCGIQFDERELTA